MNIHRPTICAREGPKVLSSWGHYFPLHSKTALYCRQPYIFISFAVFLPHSTVTLMLSPRIAKYVFPPCLIWVSFCDAVKWQCDLSWFCLHRKTHTKEKSSGKGLEVSLSPYKGLSNQYIHQDEKHWVIHYMSFVRCFYPKRLTYIQYCGQSPQEQFEVKCLAQGHNDMLTAVGLQLATLWFEVLHTTDWATALYILL